VTITASARGRNEEGHSEPSAFAILNGGRTESTFVVTPIRSDTARSGGHLLRLCALATNGKESSQVLRLRGMLLVAFESLRVLP
jgi:hypothetical protein